MSYTAQAEIEQKAIEFNFPRLNKFYNPMMGNFQFSKRELAVNMGDITKWMELFPEYIIMRQEIKEYNGKNYFLTDTFQ